MKILKWVLIAAGCFILLIMAGVIRRPRPTGNPSNSGQSSNQFANLGVVGSILNAASSLFFGLWDRGVFSSSGSAQEPGYNGGGGVYDGGGGYIGE